LAIDADSESVTFEDACHKMIDELRKIRKLLEERPLL
jgi:hypothetical protein